MAENDIKVSSSDWKDVTRDGQKAMAFLENMFSDVLARGWTAEEMEKFSTEQVTLLAYLIFRREMLEGGLVQLIYNGYGPFLFRNPFAKILRSWGLKDFSRLVYDAAQLYGTYGSDIEGKDLSDEDFMALYEQFPEMEAVDDDFVETETAVSAEITNFVSRNPALFGIIVE